MSKIPVREMIKNAIDNLGGRATHKQIKNWVNEKYENVNQNTLSTQINTSTVNMPGRVGIPENDHPREFDSRYDFLYSVGRGEVVFYEPKIHGTWTIMNNDNGKTVIAKDGIPISKPSSGVLKLLPFLKQKTLFRNYVPIIIKLILEKRNESSFTVSINEIKENFDKLNFNRSDYNFSDALRAAKGALKYYVSFSDETAAFHLHTLDAIDIPECLRICGRKIAQYHINELTNNEFDLYHILPGRTKENFPYLDEFLETNSIGIGWDKVRDVTNLSESEIKNDFDRNYQQGFASFSSFMKIKPKDIIILTKGQKEIVDFGIVIGDYVFKDVSDPSYPHRKNVVWLNQGPISANELPGKKLAGFMDTAAIVREKRDMLIEVLLGKQTMAAYKAHSCFILTPDDRYPLTSGQFQYNHHHPNYKQLISGSKFVLRTKVHDEYFFIGFGKIDSIQNESILSENDSTLKQFTASFSKYTEMEPPKNSSNIYSEIKSQNNSDDYLNVSILPISRKLFSQITGEDLGESEDVVDMSEIPEIVKILKKKKNVILYGPPGTGKTFTTTQIAKSFVPSVPKHTWRSVATLVLLENGGLPLHYREITSRALEKNLVETRGETPHETIAKEMRNDMDEKGNGSYFVKPEDGIYGLNIPTNFSKVAEIILFANNKSMHSDTITRISVKNNMIKQNDPPGTTPERSMNQVLSQDISNNGINSTFIKTKGATYELRKKNPPTYEIDISVHPQLKFVTFHPSYSYEDFVEGIRPVVEKSNNSSTKNNSSTNHGEKISYSLENGIFKIICKDASDDPDNDYLLIIDEINRGNMSKIFGELITLIEDDKRNKLSLNLAYSKESFTVPDNLYILGTMNTADKSLIQLDAALRRRFAFKELMPDYHLEHLEKVKIPVKIKSKSEENSELKIIQKPLKEILKKLNDKIIKKDLRDKQIGHSYFLRVNNIDDLKFVFRYEIIPLLQDYFYGNYEELEKILGTRFISKDEMTINDNVLKDSDKFSTALGYLFEKDE